MPADVGSNKQRRTLLSALVAIFVVSIGCATATYLWVDIGPNTPQLEIFKALLQVGLVSAAGAILSLLTYEYQQQRQNAEKCRDEERRLAEKARDEEQRRAEKAHDEEKRRLEFRLDLLKSTLTKADVVYNEVKRARRLLRARRLTGLTHLAKDYDTQLPAISNAQLQLGMLIGDIETNGSAFSDAAKLIKLLRTLEKHLDNLITEYENELGMFAGDPKSRMENELPVLKKFLVPARQGGAFKESVEGVREARKIIRKDVADLAGSTDAYHRT